MPEQKIRYFKRIVWPLAIAQMLLWAGLYYLFPALLDAWERDLGWSKAELSVGLTSALLVAAVLAPLAGREIDHDHGRIIFVGSAVGAAVLMALLSQVTALWQFYVIWTGIGIAMAGCLYEPCFAVLTRYMGERARQSITLVTLVAGFAGTLAFPSAHALIGIIGWRGVTLVFAAVILFVAAPLILYAVKQAEDDDQAPPEEHAVNTGQPLTRQQLVTFWLLALAFAMIAFNHGMIIAHLLPLLFERGVNQDTAVFAAAMIGPMQVMGRLALYAFERNIAAVGMSMGAFVAMALSALALLGAGAAPMLLVVFVLFHGAGYGITTIIRPVAVADLLGRRRHGVIAGMLAVPYLAVFALAPTIAGVIWRFGGYDVVLMVAGGGALLGLAAITLAARTATAEVKT